MNEELAKYQHLGGFPGGAAVKTSPSSIGGAGSLPKELRSHVPLGQNPKNIKQKQYCNKFNKDFKMNKIL